MRLGSICRIVIAATLCSVQLYAAEAVNEQARFREIYQQLIEINTTQSQGTAKAATAMRQWLLGAGFTTNEIQIFEPVNNQGNLVARLKGTGQKKPLLLLAHLDVVEARAADWKTDPFKLQERDGYFIGRGVIDDKAMAASFVSVLAQLKREGFRPQRDIVLALTSGEEALEGANGASWLVDHQRQLIDAEFGINEGGRGELKDGKPSVHVMQVGEKQYVTYELEVTSPGGHSARPTGDNAIYTLSEALLRIGQFRFPLNITDAARVYFERTARFSSGQVAEDMKAVAAGQAGAAAIDRISTRPDLVGMLRTTCVATQVKAGQAENALPQRAWATVNCRVLPNESDSQVEAKLKELAGSKVVLRVVQKSVPAPPSPLMPAIMKPAEQVTEQMWPGVPVIPAMGVSTTDSRWLRAAGIPMYGISGIFVNPADTGVHGMNEHAGVKQIYDGREFLYRLIKALAE
jgi:acetylornithine deacetylase/succinyl-diaminopimelate desuccinylase-like protein